MTTQPQTNHVAGRCDGRESGQALVEYVIMLSMFAVVALVLFVLMAVFSEYGWRMVSLVSMDL
ncbi:MAG: hypothetical protein PHQ27_01840 [Victivallales bacterium]|nr:hypothetical protein [Victivallales bacterium]